MKENGLGLTSGGKYRLGNYVLEMHSKLSFSETIPFKSDTLSLLARTLCQQVLGRWGGGRVRQRYLRKKRLHMSVWEPRMSLRRAELRKSERTGRLQSTEAVWDSSCSGTLHSGSDSRRQTAHGVKGPVLDPGTEGREEVLMGRTMKQRKKPGRVKSFL